MLPELEDQSWFPAALREQQTAYIGWMVQAFGIYRNLPPVVSRLAEAQGGMVTDLGSGSGGPLISLAKDPQLRDVSFLLTDKFPQPVAGLPMNCAYHRASLDAVNPVPTATGLVTMFNALHHFNKAQRDEMVRRLMLNGRSFMAAEILAPSIIDVLRIFMATTLGQLLLAPFVRPFSVLRLLLTYVLPVNLLTITWDGLASVSRGLQKKDWDHLIIQAQKTGARARVIRTGRWFAPVTVFICEPPGMKAYF